MPKFHGVIPPIITPMDDQGRIQEDTFGKLVDWYAEAGCHGLWVCGGTGEGVSLTRDERIRMVELTNECVAGRMQIIFHVGAITTDDALAAARGCQDLNVDAICSVPPFFFGKSDDEVVAYYRRLAEVTDRPLFLYNLPGAAGVELRLELIEKIVAQVPTVMGIKQSAGVVDFVFELRRALPQLTVLIGRGETTLPALTLGASGVVCASLCMAPRRFVALYDAYVRGDLRQSLEAQAAASSVKEIYRHFPVIAATKRANQEQLGLECGAPREPLAQLAPEEEPRLIEMARSLGLLSEVGAQSDVAPKATSVTARSGVTG
jgi:dihydrodipicolinate synthase/N-acetylneuraminate lyase